MHNARANTTHIKEFLRKQPQAPLKWASTPWVHEAIQNPFSSLIR